MENQRYDANNSAIMIKGEAAQSLQVLEGLSISRKEDGHILQAQFNRSAEVSTSMGDSRTIDVSWLRSASSVYNISDDPRDYVFPDLPIVEADIPNRNWDSFSLQELLTWKALHGRVTYGTFLHKPTHIDHHNGDPYKAKGAVFDVLLQKIGNTFCVRVLLGFDRTKDPVLVRDIVSRKRDSYSMGALARYLRCSICGALTDVRYGCTHVVPKQTLGTDFGGMLSYNLCQDVNFVEVSSVENPAMPRAKQFSLIQE